MSDLSEIRRELTMLRETAARISADVAWIKEGIESDRKEVKELRSDLNTNREHVARVDRRQWFHSGFAAAIGALLGIGGSHGLKL